MRTESDIMRGFKAPNTDRQYQRLDDRTIRCTTQREMMAAVTVAEDDVRPCVPIMSVGFARFSAGGNYLEAMTSVTLVACSPQARVEVERAMQKKGCAPESSPTLGTAAAQRQVF